MGQLYDHKRGIADGIVWLGMYYWFTGDFNTAFEHFDHGIRILEENLNELWDFIVLATELTLSMKVSLDIEDQERAKKYFKRLEEIWTLKPNNFIINDVFRIAKAMLLKASMRSRDRVMAEDLFREIIEDARFVFLFKFRADIEFCELLLVELRISKDINIITELKPLIEKLIGMAQKSGFHYYLIEAYILHGKLALIMFDISSSRRYLTQARRMAERFGYIKFAEEIAGLHKAMMAKIHKWEEMERNDAPLSELIELARLDDHLKGTFRTRMMKMERISEGDVTVYKDKQTCLVCKGSVEGFSIYI